MGTDDTADISARLGRAKAAEKHFQAALALGENPWLLGAYADFLLTQDRAHEVVELLKNHTSVDDLLLLLTLAEQAIDGPRFDKHVAMLRARFKAARLRKDQRHLREKALFGLRLLNRPQTALRIASVNWQIQHEPEDARILLQAALAAGKPQAAVPVIEFLQRTRLEDVRLRQLSRRLKESLGA